MYVNNHIHRLWFGYMPISSLIYTVDIWDGEDEPVIYHGRTLTSKVSLANVARAISRYAFVASPYPIIISAEIRCNIKQQDQAADIMRREFGNALVTSTLDGEDVIEALPSPERLKHRILLKVRGSTDANALAQVPKHSHCLYAGEESVRKAGRTDRKLCLPSWRRIVHYGRLSGRSIRV